MSKLIWKNNEIYVCSKNFVYIYSVDTARKSIERFSYPLVAGVLNKENELIVATTNFHFDGNVPYNQITIQYLDKNILAQYDIPMSNFKSAIFTSFGEHLIFGILREAVVLYANQSTSILRFQAEHDQWVWCMAHSSDNNIFVTGGEDKTIRIWDIKSGICRGEIPQASQDFLRSLLIDPMNRYLFSSGGTREGVWIWDLKMHKRLAQLPIYVSNLGTLCFNSSGNSLAASDIDVQLSIWDMKELEVIAQIGNDIDLFAREIVFSPDDSKLAVIHLDGTVRIWDAVTLKQVAILDNSIYL